LALHQQIVCGNDLSIYDAAEIFDAGWVIEMEDGNYEAAANLVREFFQHPDIQSADVITQVEFRCKLAISLLCGGDEKRAIGIFRSLLRAKYTKRSREIVLLTIRNRLHTFCGIERKKTNVASTSLTRLVRDVVNTLGKKGMIRKSIPTQATYKELCSLLESTYPVEKDTICTFNTVIRG
jgi:hypothetical protein